MKEKIINLFKFLFFLGLGFLLIWWSVKDLTDADVAEIKSAFANANYWWIGLSLVAAMASHVSRSLRWQMMLEPVAKKPSFGNILSAVMVNYLANLAFPRLGEAMRCGLIQRYEGIPFEKSFGTLMVERLIDLIILLSLTLFIFLTQFEVLGNFLSERFGMAFNDKIAALTGNIAFLIGLGVLGILGVALVGYLIWRFREQPFIAKIINFGKGFMEGILSVRKVKNLPLFLFHTIFIWAMYIAMTYLCFYSMEATENLGFYVGMAVFVFGGFSILATQGGIGAYQLIVQAVLVLYGVASNPALAFGWLVWSAQTLLVLVAGFIALGALSVMNRK